MSVNHHLLCSEFSRSCVQLEGSSDAYCNIWTDAEPARFKSCSNRSFAMDARIRLDNLKAGCNSPSPCCASDRALYSFRGEKDIMDSEETQEEQSALDLVEILDIEDDVQDEESWLYESPRKQSIEENRESALRWCRHVFDNPSPEMEAACRVLMNVLDQKSSHPFYRRPGLLHHAASVSEDSSSISTTHNASDTSDHNELNISNDSITASYRLQDITDVHIMARIQEASLRQDYISMPATASPKRSTESPVMFSSGFSATAENTDDFTPRHKTEASSSSCWQSGVPSRSSCPYQSAATAAMQGCQSPRLARLHQQVTQFKLLKLAQNQASPGRMRSPLRTSLRSLQAVRNSRSLETDDCQAADQITHPPTGTSSTRMGSSYWSTSRSPAPLNSSVRTAAIKKLQRSQSLSPCRIPHPAKGYLSVHRRVFASPERPTSAAWARNLPSIRR
ncbi:SLAIN motif-containing protein-like isoform X1 [Acanthochromis polyacanthus]|uniref:SLAIN motif-containing protein-like isoform X1 n=2 Tax=Acanthochromis polyacanthus TaxID=80966 RepID=UPI0022344ACF|nr:SLAIN motif-containing protein-like isoform X1 [Acanthochromis polyacanthus]